eukprot:12295250-Heterocapsa_arctica.AAC.1
MSPWRDSKGLDLEVIDVELSGCGASVQAGHWTVVSDLTVGRPSPRPSALHRHLAVLADILDVLISRRRCHRVP